MEPKGLFTVCQGGDNYLATMNCRRMLPKNIDRTSGLSSTWRVPATFWVEAPNEKLSDRSFSTVDRHSSRLCGRKFIRLRERIRQRDAGCSDPISLCGGSPTTAGGGTPGADRLRRTATAGLCRADADAAAAMRDEFLLQHQRRAAIHDAMLLAG